MKFRFPLQKVMQHRKTVEDLAQREFQEAVAALNAEIKKRDDMINSEKSARDYAFQAQLNGGRASSDLTQVHEFLVGQDVRIERQEKVIEEHQRKVEELREILRQRAVDRKIMESLRERKKQEFVTEQRRLEQKQQDEVSIMRFKRKDSE